MDVDWWRFLDVQGVVWAFRDLFRHASSPSLTLPGGNNLLRLGNTALRKQGDAKLDEEGA